MRTHNQKGVNYTRFWAYTKKVVNAVKFNT